MRSSFFCFCFCFCFCLERCESMADAWESRPLLSGLRCHEPAAAASHRDGRSLKRLASEDACQSHPQSNLLNLLNVNTLV